MLINQQNTKQAQQLSSSMATHVLTPKQKERAASRRMHNVSRPTHAT